MNSLQNQTRKIISTSKPLIIYDTTITSENLATFRKKCPRHAKEIRVEGKLNLTLKLRNLKTLQSIYISEEGEENSHKIPYKCLKRARINKTLKALKPYQKCLKNYEGDNDLLDEVEKYLPNSAVACLYVVYDREFKNFLSKTNYEKIIFHFPYAKNLQLLETESDSKTLNFIQKVKSRLARHFQKLRKIKEVQLHVHGCSLETFSSLLEILQQNTRLLPSLKHLKVIPKKYYRIKDTNPTSDHGARIIKNALPYITFLQTYIPLWFSAPILYKHMTNLQEINVEINPRKECTFDIQLPAFKNLTKLRAIRFSFSSIYREDEKTFIESFTLPSSIEKVDLSLKGFEWKGTELTKKVKEKIEFDFKEHPRYINFFKQWKNLPNLKNLYLTMVDKDQQRDSVSICASFAAHIFKNVKSLVQAVYSNHIYRPEQDPFAKPTRNATTVIKPAKPADLKKIWQSLVPSRKTLEYIKIRIPEMNFVPSINSIETDFPKLQQVGLFGKVYWATEAIYFGRALFDQKEGKDLRFQAGHLHMQDLKRFKIFLKNINDIIPARLNTQISLDMCDLRGEIWIDDFCDFLRHSKTDGDITLELYNVTIQSYKAIQRVKEVVLKHRVFSNFSMKFIYDDRGYFRVCKEKSEADNDETKYLISRGYVKMDI